MTTFWKVRVASNYLSRMMRRASIRKFTLQYSLWWFRTLPVGLELEYTGADFSNQGSFWEISSPLAHLQLRWTQLAKSWVRSQKNLRSQKMCPLQPYHPRSCSTVTLDHITHAEIQRNLGNSQKTVVNSGDSLTSVVTVTHRDAVLPECSHDTFEVWNLNRIWVGKWPKGNFPLFY